MSSILAMSILFVVLAVALLVLFTGLWLKDRDRSEEEAHDTDRLDTDTTHGEQADPTRTR